jgi:hypothetical protein
MIAGVEVVALGARTPVGLYAESAAAAVRAGISRIGTHDAALSVIAQTRFRAIASSTRVNMASEAAVRCHTCHRRIAAGFAVPWTVRPPPWIRAETPFSPQHLRPTD